MENILAIMELTELDKDPVVKERLWRDRHYRTLSFILDIHIHCANADLFLMKGGSSG